jgi:hypothetical protein
VKTFVVFIKFRMPVTGHYVRYIDSQWATAEHAATRKLELEHSLFMFDVPGFEVLIRTGMVADAAINSPEVLQ